MGNAWARLAVLVAICTLSSAPAAAAVSVAGGGFATSLPAQSGGGVLVTSSTAVPAVPLEVQGSLFAPIGKYGGYAVTAEIRGLSGGGFGGAYVGGGVGIGRLPSATGNSTLLTLFVGKPIAPLTTIELRYYQQSEQGSKGLLFAGLRFTL